MEWASATEPLAAFGVAIAAGFILGSMISLFNSWGT